MALCHDFMHLSIMKSMASYRFDKICRQVIYFVLEQNTLFRRIVPVDQFPSFRLLYQLDSFTTGRDRFAVLVSLIDEPQGIGGLRQHHCTLCRPPGSDGASPYRQRSA